MKGSDMRDRFFKQMFRWGVTVFGAALGGSLAVLVLRLLVFFSVITPLAVVQMVWIGVVAALLFGAVSFFIAPRVILRLRGWVDDMERMLGDTPAMQLLAGTMGLILGLVIATLVTQLFRIGLPDLLWASFSAIVYVMLGYLGIRVATKRWREMPLFSKRERRGERVAIDLSALPAKLLDTSVLIDGRILDICKTGFLEGTLIVPQFVLAELQAIADSGETLRRNRGRRGLDVLAKLQKELEQPVQVAEAEEDETDEVDVRLLKLAKQLGGIVVTNDLNLNKVAGVTGIKVLNINDLANAVKPMLLPGERLSVQVVREGKEPGQGVGFLPDGTMIVVENARRHVGETLEVMVTTALQTSAGRMIFAKCPADEKVG